MMDPEHRDEMERRGDSLLDEERWQREFRERFQDAQMTSGGQVLLTFRSSYRQRPIRLTIREAQLMAHSILTVIEIAGRTKAGEFDE